VTTLDRVPEEALTLDPLHRRVRHGMRHSRNWLQLLRFGVVGLSGYAVNLGVYAFFAQVLGTPYLLAASAAFLVAVSNNFLWNRRFTFKVRHGRRRHQAARFLIVSLVAFAASLAVLAALVELAGVDKIAAQAIAVIAGLPLNFLGQRLWSFRR
jgi:putative flippase GtrA